MLDKLEHIRAVSHFQNHFLLMHSLHVTAESDKISNNGTLTRQKANPAVLGADISDFQVLLKIVTHPTTRARKIYKYKSG